MTRCTVEARLKHFPLRKRGTEGDLTTHPIRTPVKSPLPPFAKGGKPHWSDSP